MKYIFFILSFTVCQNYSFAQKGILKDTTYKVLVDLDKLLEKNPSLESKYIGESQKLSKKYELYESLLAVADTSELSFIILNYSKSGIKCYAYMALYKMGYVNLAKKRIVNQPINLDILIGDKSIPIDDPVLFIDFFEQKSIKNNYVYL